MSYVKCHICYHNNTNKETMHIACERCAADLANPESEVRIAAGGAYSTFSLADKKGGPHQAELYLTNKRLLLIPLKLQGAGLSGILTAAVVNKMAPGIISLPTEKIKAVRKSQSKAGLFKKETLVLDTADGQSLTINPTKRQLNQWIEALEKIMNEQGSGR